MHEDYAVRDYPNWLADLMVCNAMFDCEVSEKQLAVAAVAKRSRGQVWFPQRHAAAVESYVEG